MAKPRVFISSTYYDLKHIRASLDLFVESLGFEPVLSEKGAIAYSPDVPLDESCYREVGGADLFVLIIGGRYGTEATGQKKGPHAFFERYDSITKKEYEEAARRDIPTYVLIDASVYSEYHTYLRNKGVESISFAHVESVNIYHLVESILNKPRNNPVQTFERFSDIEEWLREQWAGLFRELLQKMSNQQQLSELSSQIADLREVNSTLKTYLEAVLRGESSSSKSETLIEAEAKRLEERRRHEQILKNDFIRWVSRLGPSEQAVIDVIGAATSFDDLISRLKDHANDAVVAEVKSILQQVKPAAEDLNEVRVLLDKPKLRVPRRKESDS